MMASRDDVCGPSKHGAEIRAEIAGQTDGWQTNRWLCFKTHLLLALARQESSAFSAVLGDSIPIWTL
jgi:hypothetical protein